jgi:hypothetical protein
MKNSAVTQRLLDFFRRYVNHFNGRADTVIRVACRWWEYQLTFREPGGEDGLRNLVYIQRKVLMSSLQRKLRGQAVIAEDEGC